MRDCASGRTPAGAAILSIVSWVGHTALFTQRKKPAPHTGKKTPGEPVQVILENRIEFSIWTPNLATRRNTNKAYCKPPRAAPKRASLRTKTVDEDNGLLSSSLALRGAVSE